MRASGPSLTHIANLAQLTLWDWDVAEGMAELSGFGIGEYQTINIRAVGEIADLIARCHPEDVERLAKALEASFETGEDVEIEHRLLENEHGVRHVLHRVDATKDDAGKIVRMTGVWRDVSQRKHAEEQVAFLSNYDPVTYLPNREFFAGLIDTAIARCAENGDLLAVLAISLQGFNKLGTSFGAGLETHLVREVGQRLTRILGEQSEAQPELAVTEIAGIGRLGDDQFGLIVAGALHVQEVAQKAREILIDMKEPFLFAEREVFVQAKIGIALVSEAENNGETLCRAAQQAVHQIRAVGRDAYAVYAEDPASTEIPRMEMHSALHRALGADQLELYYQPQVDLASGKVVGAEALVRLRDPDKGLLTPDQFIDLAHETGRIFEIGAWAIDQGCAQIDSWKKAGIDAVPISVNVTSHEFYAGDLLRLVDDALSKHQVDPGLLSIEITESFIMMDVAKSTQVMLALKDLGVGLALDDFGTGYSSLSYLKDFPVDTLKMDQSFVKDLTEDKSSAAMSRAIIALANGLQLKVVAEGVETEEQLKVLEAQGCRIAQGYLFSIPLPPDEMTRVLQGEPPQQMSLLVEP